jgi:hypothetical protein
MIIYYAGHMHVRSRDPAFTSGLQYIGHVCELALFIACAGRNPMIKDTEQSIDVLPQLFNLRELLSVQSGPRPGKYVLDARPQTQTLPAPGYERNDSRSGNRQDPGTDGSEHDCYLPIWSTTAPWAEPTTAHQVAEGVPTGNLAAKDRPNLDTDARDGTAVNGRPLTGR